MERQGYHHRLKEEVPGAQPRRKRAHDAPEVIFIHKDVQSNDQPSNAAIHGKHASESSGRRKRKRNVDDLSPDPVSLA